MGSSECDVEHGVDALRLSSSSVHIPHTTQHAKPSKYMALETSGTKHSLCEHWDESIGYCVHRLARTMRRHAHTPSCTLNNTVSRLHLEIENSIRFYLQHLVVFQREMLCGVAAMLLMIPETVAFSYAANLDPLNGLYATGFLALSVSLFGGVPSTVAGAAGAVAMVMPTITSSTGSLDYLTYEERLEHLFVAVTIAGIFELLFGLFQLSKLFTMIPRTAHIGFLNGLALMMFLSQKTTIQICTNDTMRFGECEMENKLEYMSVASPITWVTIALVLVTMAIMHLFPRIPFVGQLIPPTLLAAIIGVGFEFGINRPFLGYNVRTIGDTSPLNGGLPTFAIPEFSNIQDWGVVLSTAASIMAVGLFESLMTLQSVVDLKKEQLSQTATRKECIAQGVGNILCGLFSGMGGCSMIAQSNGNILNGARHRLSSFMCGICTFLVVFFASPLIERVPVACLTGILFVIVIHTFYWPTFKLLFRIKITDAIAIVLVTVLAAAMNLAIAVIVGVIWQCLVNSWQSGRMLTFHTGTIFVPVVNVHGSASENELLMSQEEAKIYYLKGQLLFSSVACFRDFFDVKNDPNVVILDMQDCGFADFSAVAALREAAMRYREAGKTLVARNLDDKSLDLLSHDFGWISVEHIQNEIPGTENEYVKNKFDLERTSQGSLHQLHIVSPSDVSTAYRAAAL
ncbi:sulfate permease family [Plasmopara halstedii]|uniref:Sulfate permease family n=1 Tax=Plasmopara halstedii TaxID=4781 RepID=A0A0P1AC57_PLAHL|nr:sulfate permease family [Plasmopara halstedii]CEG38445.1 sulfate permease family [Plasmopara halstedii]|eukprot:XP_024574814.1 sulfate permease family [Plasmopara halstedii]